MDRGRACARGGEQARALCLCLVLAVGLCPAVHGHGRGRSNCLTAHTSPSIGFLNMLATTSPRWSRIICQCLGGRQADVTSVCYKELFCVIQVQCVAVAASDCYTNRRTA